jgi:hypothetical protein
VLVSSVGAQDSVTLSLEPEAPFVGKVVDPKGEPIENSAVTIYVGVGDNQNSGNSILNASTDAMGLFHLRNQPAGTRVSLIQVAHERFQPKNVNGAPFPSTAENPVRIELDPGGEISGVVVDERGKPIPYAIVQRRAGSKYAHGFRMTGPDGRFRFSNCPPGEYTVVGEHRRYAAGFATATVKLGEPVNDLTIQLTAGGYIEGKVTTSDDKPFAGSTLQVAPVDPEGRPPSNSIGDVNAPWRTAATDDVGNFRLGPLPLDVSYHVYFNDLGPHAASPIVAKAGDAGIVVKLAP